MITPHSLVYAKIYLPREDHIVYFIEMSILYYKQAYSQGSKPMFGDSGE